MRCECKQIEQLIDQVKKHEQTIVQLIEIIGTTNRRVSELNNQKKELHKVVSTH